MRSKTVAGFVGAAFLLVGSPMALAKPTEGHFSGEVSHLDAAAKTVVVKQHKGKPAKEMTFTLAPGAKIMQGARSKSLGDLEVGERVKVTYADQGTAHQAKRIDVLAARTAKAKPADAPETPPKSGD